MLINAARSFEIKKWDMPIGLQKSVKYIIDNNRSDHMDDLICFATIDYLLFLCQRWELEGKDLTTVEPYTCDMCEKKHAIHSTVDGELCAWCFVKAGNHDTL